MDANSVDGLLQDLALKLDLANMELTTIDEVLARRPALDKLKHRTEKIERMCAVNGDLLAALKAAHQELVGLRAYLDTCDSAVIIENLPSLTTRLGQQCASINTVIRKAEGK